MICIHCNNDIPKDSVGKKFCSQSCSATYNNLRKPKKERPKFECLHCHSEMDWRKSSRNRYCDNKCQMEYQFYNVKIPAIINGDLHYGSTSVRRYLIERDGDGCSVCGITKWNGKDISLDTDHIDGIYTNNAGVNLRLICPNCHRQTDTWGNSKFHRQSNKNLPRRR